VPSGISQTEEGRILKKHGDDTLKGNGNIPGKRNLRIIGEP
jgi:hypothetical protein